MEFESKKVSMSRRLPDTNGQRIVQEADRLDRRGEESGFWQIFQWAHTGILNALMSVFVKVKFERGHAFEDQTVEMQTQIMRAMEAANWRAWHILADVVNTVAGDRRSLMEMTSDDGDNISRRLVAVMNDIWSNPVSVHALPYTEDETISVEDARENVESVRKQNERINKLNAINDKVRNAVMAKVATGAVKMKRLPDGTLHVEGDLSDVLTREDAEVLGVPYESLRGASKALSDELNRNGLHGFGQQVKPKGQKYDA